MRAYTQSLSRLENPCEIVIVVNGNVELNPELLQVVEFSQLKSSVVRFHRKADESIAIQAGIQAGTGEIILLLPSYRQVDEQAIVDMLNELNQGYDYVASWRQQRIDSRLSIWASRIFNSITRRVTGGSLHDVNSGLKIFRRQVVANLPMYGDMHRFLPVLADMRGFRVSEIPVKHVHERVRPGEYRLGVFFRRILDLMSLFFLCKFAKKPLRFFGMLGNFFIAVGGTVVVYLVIERLFGTALADRPALLLAVLMVVLGFQLFSLGLLGETDHFRARPPFPGSVRRKGLHAPRFQPDGT